MPLVPIKLKPGIDRSNTNYGNTGGYYACDKVRFRDGTPEKIGGWDKYTAQTFLGTARNLFCWSSLTGSVLLAAGTSIKYYIESGGGLADVTPYRTVNDALGTAPLSATSGSSVLVVTHANHGANDGDYVVLSGVATFAGIPVGSLNTEFSATVIDANTYSIVVDAVANTTVLGGGASVLASFELTSASDVAVPGFGWNAGAWERGAWNDPAPVAAYTTLRLWTQESFGEDHVFAPVGGSVYYWKFSNGVSTRAILLTSLAGASNTPLYAIKLLLSTSDRHLIVFGTNPIGSTDIDPLYIRWADTESLTNWTPSVTNAAGGIRLSSGNRIVTAVKLKQEIIVFTDGSLFSMQFIGAPNIFGIFPTADNISIASSNAVTVANDTIFWMGGDKFYTYNGRVSPLHCPINKFIFDNMSSTQFDQTFAGTNEGFNEIWWFYVSRNSLEVDSYVIFNYVENIWSYGTMKRSAWIDSPLKDYPIATGGNLIYNHEHGVDDAGDAIHAYIESTDFDITDGNSFSFVNRVLPDVTFVGSTASAPKVTMTITPRNSPGSSYRAEPANAVVRSASVPIEQFTERCDLRLRGRQLKMRIESNDAGVQWKLGVPRIEIRTDGKK